MPVARDPSGSGVSALDAVEIVFRWLLFFPTLAIERIFGLRIPAVWTGLGLSVAAFVGLYDVLYGTLVYPLYNIAAEFSNTSLVNSLLVLGGTKVAEYAVLLYPPLSPLSGVLETVGNYVENGVLALAAQSALLIVVTKGFLLKYIFGFGFLLLAIPPLAAWAQRFLFASLLIFIVMPLVVGSEAILYNTLRSPIEADLKEQYDEIKEVVSLSNVMDGTISAVSGAASATSEAVSNSYKDSTAYFFGGSDETEVLVEGTTEPEVLEDDPGMIETLQGLLMAIFDGLILLFLLTLFTCLIAPVVAYVLIFKLLRRLLTQDAFGGAPAENT